MGKVPGRVQQQVQQALGVGVGCTGLAEARLAAVVVVAAVVAALRWSAGALGALGALRAER